MLPVCAFKIVPGVLRTKERCPSAESQPPEKYMNTVLTTIFFATWSIEAIRVHGGPPLFVRNLPSSSSSSVPSFSSCDHYINTHSK
jgi:hypothetical protein